MKKIIFSALSVFMSLIAWAQDHPGEQVQLLLNKELKVSEIHPGLQSLGYRDFLTTPEVTYKNIYKSDKDGNTPYNELVGKIFKVTQIIPYKDEFMLKLENAETGTIYYKYSPRNAVGFDFNVIGGLPTEFYCGKIESKNNGGYPALYTPPIKGSMLIKETVGGKPNVMIRALVRGDTVEVNKKGMIITLENGKMINKPLADIDVSATSDKSRYTTVASLTNAELKLLSESPIVRMKLGSFSENFNDLGTMMYYAKCFLK